MIEAERAVVVFSLVFLGVFAAVVSHFLRERRIKAQAVARLAAAVTLEQIDEALDAMADLIGWHRAEGYLTAEQLAVLEEADAAIPYMQPTCMLGGLTTPQTAGPLPEAHP